MVEILPLWRITLANQLDSDAGFRGIHMKLIHPQLFYLISLTSLFIPVHFVRLETLLVPNLR